jgi:hypothetical protein
VFFDNTAIDSRDLFLALMPAKISTAKNIERPPKLIISQPCFDCKTNLIQYVFNLPLVMFCIELE